jgi:lipoprotein-releasing system permease protein
LNINTDIAKTYVVSNKKLTAVAALGVILGMSIYIFMNSMLVGFDRSSSASVFKNTSHIRVYNDDVTSLPLVNDSVHRYLIVNPHVVPKTNTILNPKMVTDLIMQQEEVVVASPQASVSVFYNNGKSQLAGVTLGINPDEADMMYSISSTMVEGNFSHLKNNPNGILIGSGIVKKMNLGINDNINLTSSRNINRNFKIVGIFKTNNSNIDKTKCYVNLAAAQQLLAEGSTYVTDVNVNITNPDDAKKVAQKISSLTGYTAEGWKESNETLMAANRMRKIIITFVSLTILIVAGFGIYNILNMTITQKINEIAILKAMGFTGRDVIRIFVTQALTIGIMGVAGGIIIAIIMVSILKRVYVGGDIGYFPIDYELKKFIQGVVIGIVITFLAGYIPAKKASKVDPVAILRD